VRRILGHDDFALPTPEASASGAHGYEHHDRLAGSCQHNFFARLSLLDQSGKGAPNTEVTFEIVDGEARLRKARRESGKLSRGDGVIGHIRSAHPSNKLTTDAIMAHA
jgi:hypothetical protein